MKITDAVNVDDLRQMAKCYLPRMIFDYIEGGVEDELGVLQNRLAFERRQIVPRYLVDITKRTQSTELFGRRYDSPFGIAPTGFAGLARPGADLMLAQAAMKANIPYVMSSASMATLEEAAKIAPAHTWFQLYAARDVAIYSDMVKRAEAAGIETLVVTVDTPFISKRERDIRNGFGSPERRLSTILDGLAHPAWTYRYTRSGGMPSFGNWVKYTEPVATPMAVATLVRSQMPRPITWHDLETIRRLWPGNLLVKGVMHPDDALQIAEFGCEGIIVSNHGGRQLDRAIASIDVLEPIKAAVGDRMVIMLDSGIRRGADILVALCLGASFVFAGRAPLYGVAAGGLSGASRAIRILRGELDLIMAQIGTSSIESLNQDFIVERD